MRLLISNKLKSKSNILNTHFQDGKGLKRITLFGSEMPCVLTMLIRPIELIA